ncbi:MAG TPA: hypothetical protein EYP56_10385 [Planctomycetaceae bacterium]|nr:hypothetical protein [Planctomycetaceae bacterium]
MIGKVDAYGLTHRGRVRPTNQDHFLIADVSGSLRVRQSSLDRADEPEEEAAGAGKDRGDLRPPHPLGSGVVPAVPGV